MKTKILFETDDETRARIRAFNGRGGLASRGEVRAFVLEELAESVKNLPQPKRRGQAKPKPIVEVPVLSRSIAKRLEASGVEGRQAAAPPAVDGVCRNCGEVKSTHDRGKFCKVSRTVKPGSTFVLLAGLEAQS